MVNERFFVIGRSSDKGDRDELVRDSSFARFFPLITYEM